jgi:ATP-binding protein involved in chromosome partitioning
MITEKDVLGVLSKVKEPELGRDLVSLGMVKDITIDGGKVSFTIVLTTPACPLTEVIEQQAKSAVVGLRGVSEVTLKWESNVPTDDRIMGRMNLPLRNTIAVSSGKGGVGKSTIAANLAVALAQSGAGVGLMDADVYGPNIPMMLGVDRIPAPRDGKLYPALAYGLRVMSMGFLVPPDQPVIWRGPMIHSAIRQFFSDVDWGELDYMIIDLPPGTGDAQLTLAQSVPLTGAIIVTTPQDVALGDAVKGLAMFQKLEVPILGVVENMGTFICPNCGHPTDIFGSGGGARMAARLGVPFLGSVPIDPRVRDGGDNGKPIVAIDPDGPAGSALRQIARDVAARISVINLAPELEMVASVPGAA